MVIKHEADSRRIAKVEQEVKGMREAEPQESTKNEENEGHRLSAFGAMSWPIYTSVTNVGLESCRRNSKNTFVKRLRITKWMIKAFGLTTVALGISSHTNGLSLN